MRFLLKTTGFLLLVALLLAGLALGWGHFHIRRIQPELPDVKQVVQVDRTLDLPVRLSWINTASQRMPRSAVLEPSLDPAPESPYVMSHPSFVVEWQDGRILLIDAGLDTKAAMDFGLPLEIAAGAQPMEPHEPVSERLGEHRERVAGIAFTHMHGDHTDGLTKLCEDRMPMGPDDEPIGVFQHHNQLAYVNHTTYGPKRQVREAACAELRTLGIESGLLPVPGFPGLFAIPAGGHTPGSTMYVVQLRTYPGGSEGVHDDVQTWIVTGDVVNHFQGIERGLPKPELYSLLVVPEDDARLGEVRDFLKELSREPGVRLLVNHDRNQLEATGLPRY
jgi:glyoxylase-like metal-dependent hydrolase (beta-lactamase superfamily II)